MTDASYQYAMNALQILALSPDRLDSYLPPPFPETRFHGHDGDFWSSSPLSAIVMICGECLRFSALDESTSMDSESELEATLFELSQRVNALDLPDDQDRELREALRAHDMTDIVHALELCRDGAVRVLTSLGRFEPDAVPAFSAERLLDEWSHGAYGVARRQSGPAAGAPPDHASRP